MTTARITELRNTWRDDLLGNVMPFWYGCNNGPVLPIFFAIQFHHDTTS